MKICGHNLQGSEVTSDFHIKKRNSVQFILAWINDKKNKFKKKEFELAILISSTATETRAR